MSFTHDHGMDAPTAQDIADYQAQQDFTWQDFPEGPMDWRDAGDVEPCDRCHAADFRYDGSCFNCDPRDLEADWAEDAVREAEERLTGRKADGSRA